jgi:hypothetical protein
VLLAAAGGVLAAARLSGTSGASGSAPPGSDAPAGHSQEKHYVSPRQLVGANQMLGRAVEGLELPGGDGRPVVLVFLKDGCPCNVEFEPFFQRVERLYRAEARFLAVIDAPAEAARRYAERQRVPYPVLADPGRRIIHRLKAENGGYVALLTDEGVLAGYWPGCTSDTLRELGARIAGLAGVAERPLDVSDMEAALTTGCPFEP